MSEKKLKNAIRRCPYWPSTLFNHTCVCVCFPEITPPPALQTQDGFAVVGQDGCFGPGLRSALFMQRLSTSHTPNTHQSHESIPTRASKQPIPTQLMLLWWFRQAKQLQAFLLLIIRYVLDMWKKKKKQREKKRERKHIFILLYRRETRTQDATGALFTHQQQTKGWSFYIDDHGSHLRPVKSRRSVCALLSGGPVTLLTAEKLLHCPLTRSGLNSLGSTENTTIWQKTSFLIRFSCESSRSICLFCLLVCLFFPLYCVTERGIVNRQNYV